MSSTTRPSRPSGGRRTSARTPSGLGRRALLALSALAVVSTVGYVTLGPPGVVADVRAALMTAVTLALFSIVGAVKIFNLPGHSYNGIPFMAPLIIGAVLILAAAGDVRILRSGMPRGGPRLARHLWRMCFALFIAAGSFFSIRERVAKILPEPFTTGPMRALPILLLFGAMFYWLWRVRTKPTRGLRRAGATGSVD